MSKYITFEIVEKDNIKRKTLKYKVKNISCGFVLGEIAWYVGWRQYCFFPSANTVFSSGCMDDINNFIKQLMDERKIK